jgi:hypothetical protein
MSKKRIVRALFDNLENLKVEDIAKSQQLKELLKSQVPVAILESHELRRQSAVIFEINATDHFIEIQKKDWIQALETCIMWYLESEEYEKCTKLKMIMDDIQKKPTKKVNVKTQKDGE